MPVKSKAPKRSAYSLKVQKFVKSCHGEFAPSLLKKFCSFAEKNKFSEKEFRFQLNSMHRGQFSKEIASAVLAYRTPYNSNSAPSQPKPKTKPRRKA